jgi:hypothetical protein
MKRERRKNNRARPRQKLFLANGLKGSGIKSVLARSRARQPTLSPAPERATRAECSRARERGHSNPLILSEAPSGAQSKDLSNSPIGACSCELVERSFDSGFAFAQDQGLKSGLGRIPLTLFAPPLGGRRLPEKAREPRT